MPANVNPLLWADCEIAVLVIPQLGSWERSGHVRDLPDVLGQF